MNEQQRKYHREYMRKYNATEKGALYNRNHVTEWRKRNPDARAKEYAKAKAEGRRGVDKMTAEQRSVMYRRHDLKRKYGVTPEWYDAQLEKQEGKCAICSRTEVDKKGRKLAVDHNHETGQVRGLLCARCNFSIAAFEYDPDFGTKALNYLARYKEELCLV